MDLNENQHKLNGVNENQNNVSYIDSTNRAIFGCVNGILFYDSIYPLVLLILAQLIFGAIYPSFSSDHPYVYSVMLMLINSLITLGVGIAIAGPTKLKKAYRMFNVDDIRLMITTFLLMIGATICYNAAMTLLGFNDGGGNTNQTSIEDYILHARILSCITFVIIGPVLEEVTYRYFLFGALRKINPKTAIIISGLIFMVVHGVSGFIQPNANILREILLLPPYMFSGCMLAYAYNKSDNLATSTVVHFANNLLSFVITCLYI